MAGFNFPFFGGGNDLDREYSKLRRADLLRILLERKQETEALEIELEAARIELENRRILVDESENIADAVMKMNQMYDVAQTTADQYVENVRVVTEQKLEHFEEEKQEQFLRLANKEDEINAALFEQEAVMNARLMAQEEEANAHLKEIEKAFNQRMEAKEQEVNHRIAAKEQEMNARLKAKEVEVYAACDQMLLDAKTESQKYWSEIQNKMKEFMAASMSSGVRKDKVPSASVKDEESGNVQNLAATK